MVNGGTSDPSNIILCDVRANGTFVDCAPNLIAGRGSWGIAISDNGFAYYADGLSTVYVCNFDRVTGDISGCRNAGATNIDNFMVSLAITIYGGRVYLSNSLGNGVTVRDAGPDGLLSNCVKTGTAMNVPLSITFNNGYVYVRPRDLGLDSF